MKNIVTVYLKGRYAPGDLDWQIGEVISQSGFGLTIADSRGRKFTYPVSSIESVREREGW